jgi:hypothetical protein
MHSMPLPGPFNYVIDQIKAGAMLMVGTEETCLMGRDYTKRKMPSDSDFRIQGELGCRLNFCTDLPLPGPGRGPAPPTSPV